MTKKKTILIVAILVVILAVGGWWLAGRQGRTDQAARDKQRYMSLMTSTETLITNQKYTQAEKLLNDYLKGDLPTKYERGAAVRLATVYSNAKEYDKAIEWYKKAEAMDGKPTADVAVGMAYTYDEKGDKQNAIKYFQQAVTLAEKSDDPMADSDKRSYEFEIERLKGEQ